MPLNSIKNKPGLLTLALGLQPESKQIANPNNVRRIAPVEHTQHNVRCENVLRWQAFYLHRVAASWKRRADG